MQTKKVFLGLIIGALLIAGLFLFLKQDETLFSEDKPLKPSQLDFTNSNEIQQSKDFASDVQVEDLALVDTSTTLIVLPTEAEQKLWISVEEIIQSRNDSDSRVSLLKNLSPEFKNALVSKYSSLKPENRSGRGFIVFLLAKDFKSSADLEFLQSVYKEAPCLSLENCALSTDDNSHSSGVNQTTLIYPQLVVLYQIEKQLVAKPELLNDPTIRAGILGTLKQAEAFPVPAVQLQAEKLRQKFKL